jgi:hypothetical protein
MPQYTQRFGWSLRIGVTMKDTSSHDLRAGVVVNQRDKRFYQYAHAILPMLRTPRSGIDLALSVTNLDGSRGGVVGGRLSQMCIGRDEPWMLWTADVVFLDYLSLSSLGPRLWQEGNLFGLHAGVNIDGWNTKAHLLEPFTLELGGGVGFRALGGEFNYRVLHGTLTATREPLRLLAGAGIASGHIPNQLLFDLAEVGNIRGLPLWDALGTKYLCLGAEVHARAYRSFHAIPYASWASLPDQSFHAVETGIGFTLMDPARSARKIWRIRVDFPIYIDADYGPERSWDLKRISVRVRLQDALFGKPDVDYRSP